MREVLVFLAMTVCGGGISLMFDFFRAFRRAAKPCALIVALSDILFCAAALFAVTACVWNLNSGIFRFYEPVGLILGGVFYFLLLSKWIFKLFLFIFKNILKFGGFILKILLTAWTFLYKILVV
ncbi:MAG: spore cortex biosynthesis protein YabQ, partial [Firmicutes bacterium]|nr:spore cortex biosynthesis protein YabQ [Bacillota bacterium]